LPPPKTAAEAAARADELDEYLDFARMPDVHGECHVHIMDHYVRHDDSPRRKRLLLTLHRGADLHVAAVHSQLGFRTNACMCRFYWRVSLEN
jgi:hypothetical protein